MCPFGADPKGTLKYVSANHYNIFLLTLKNIKQKYLSMRMQQLINTWYRHVKTRKPAKRKKPSRKKKYP